MDSDAKLEPFLLLAKGQKGKGLIEVINRAIAEPGLFVFGELLDVPGMQQLKDSDPTSHALLELFAYGTWHDYKGGAHKVPSLTADQELKLKQLTLATMAQDCKVLNYEDLMQRLEFANVRELEDFIIKDCMYNNALKGKLDQRRGCLKVVEVAGRDIDPHRIGALVTGIEHWMTNGAEVMANIHEQMKRIQEQSEAKAKRQEQLKAAMEEATQLLQAEGKAHRDDDGMALDDEPSVLLSGEDRTTGSRLKRPSPLSPPSRASKRKRSKLTR